MADIENGFDGFAFSEKSIRMGFIRKVYGILTLQLILTFGIVALFVLVEQIQLFAQENVALVYVAYGLSLALIIALACCGDLRRRTPFNFIFLFLFTLCEGYLLGAIAATYNASDVMWAVVATIVVTTALTIFSFQTKIDFTMLNGILFVSLIMLIVFGIFAAIFQNKIVNMVYACLGALLFSFYIVFDTQLMLGGNHKYALSPEEYIFAALNLYLDVVNLFIYLLAIIKGSG